MGVEEMAGKTGPASIQRLLKAESEANAEIAIARQNKNQLLKKARDDAELEVQSYKDKKEREFQQYKKDQEDTTGSSEKVLQKKTAEAIATVNRQVSQNADKVIKLILDKVGDVQIEEYKA